MITCPTMHIYIYTHINIIYIYTHRIYELQVGLRELVQAQSWALNLPTKLPTPLGYKATNRATAYMMGA